MNVWFVRSNAIPIHNDPLNRPQDYVPGEPHVKKKQPYLKECLAGGFARIGWPNTGPRQLGFDSERFPDSERQAVNGERFESLNHEHQGYLRDFASIRTGDLILTPVGNRLCDVYKVHIGVVVHRDRATREIISTQPDRPAYYYFHDIPSEAYECAHRVDVLWGKSRDGSFGISLIKGMNWRLAFCRVNDEVKDAAIEEARKMGLRL